MQFVSNFIHPLVHFRCSHSGSACGDLFFLFFFSSSEQVLGRGVRMDAPKGSCALLGEGRAKSCSDQKLQIKAAELSEETRVIS